MVNSNLVVAELLSVCRGKQTCSELVRTSPSGQEQTSSLELTIELAADDIPPLLRCRNFDSLAIRCGVNPQALRRSRRSLAASPDSAHQVMWSYTCDRPPLTLHQQSLAGTLLDV